MNYIMNNIFTLQKIIYLKLSYLRLIVCENQRLIYGSGQASSLNFFIFHTWKKPRRKTQKHTKSKLGVTVVMIT